MVELGLKFRTENFQSVIVIFYPSLMEISLGDVSEMKINLYWMPVIFVGIQVYSYPKEDCHNFQGTSHLNL